MKSVKLAFLITASILTAGLFSATLSSFHHLYWAYQWSRTCDFKEMATFHAMEAARINPILGQNLFEIKNLKGC